MRRIARTLAPAVFLLVLAICTGPGPAPAAPRGGSGSGGRDAATPLPVPLAPGIIDNGHHMDANNIDMFVTNHGSFAWDLQTGNPGLIYPRGSTKTAIFAAGLWIGAKVNGETRVAVAGYSQEYVPGPMANGTFQPDLPRFKCYRIDRGNTTSSDYLNWPVEDGAPTDSLGNPLLLGDATIWSVCNDADPDLHTNDAGGTAPLGLEVHQTTFAFNRAGPLGNVLFLWFKILNKGANTLGDAHVSVWSDPDLGGFTDDLVGCDTTLSLGYCYNATNSDAQYGSAPPVVALDFLRGPVVQVSPGVYDTLGMSSFNKYINGTDPLSPLETYNYMQGLNADGTPVHVNDDPFQPVTRYQVSGDPVAGTGWLDANPADRRMMLSTGPFTMAPGDSQEIVVALIIGQGTDRLSSITDARSTDSAVQAFFDLEFGGPLPPLTADLDLEPRTVNLSARAPWLTAYIEPSHFDPASIDLSTLRLAGTVPAESKFVVLGDHNRNGIPELMVKFSRDLLDPLLAPGVLDLELTGSTTTGEDFSASGSIAVIDPPVSLRAVAVSPNPLNPIGTLRFHTTAPGPARVAMYDVRGRLVRVLLEARLLPSGPHAVPIQGVGGAGGPLGSGVYYLRLETADGSKTGRIVVLK